MRRLDGIVCDTRQLGASRIGIDYEGLGPLEVCLVVLVSHEYLEPLVNIEKMVVDVLQCLIVPLECFK